ncbi:MAG: M48 family metalloprotease [Gemmatimonadales bacterium]
MLWSRSYLVCCAWLVGCSAPRTQLAPLPEGAVEAEERKQLELALLDNERQQERLDSIGFPILASGTSLCTSDLGPRLSARFATAYDYGDDWRDAARRALGVDDTLSVLSVAPGGSASRAGLRAGDRVISVDGHRLAPGAEASEALSAALAESRKAEAQSVEFVLRRDGRDEPASVKLDRMCDYGSVVLQSDELNAYSDGKSIVFTSTMMRFVNDDELRVVYSHEFAHNAMGHIKAKKKNSLFGALIGALGDIAMASRGINTGGYYTARGARAGAMSFSQDFEREADYVGLYAMALAQMNLEQAPSFWRHMAQADPKSIGLAYTHPTTAERFVRMEQAIAEIDHKRAAHLALAPEMKGATHRLVPSEEAGYALSGSRKESTAGVRSALSGDASEAVAPAYTPLAAPPAAPTSDTATTEAAAAGDRTVAAAPAKRLDAGPPPPEEGGAVGYVASPAMPGATNAAFENNPRLARTMQDLVRMRIVEHAEETEDARLIVALGKKALESDTPLAYYLSGLYLGFRQRTQWNPTTTLELWYDGRKVGEYGADGLVLARTRP